MPTAINTATAAVYKLCEWENNGYHDSYFYGAYWHADTGEVKSIELGSTAYAYTTNGPAICYANWTLDTLEQFRQHFESFIFRQLREAEDRDVLTPNKVEIGTEVKLLEAINSRKPYRLDNCQKCSGTGHWINPKNSADKRACFTCHGHGKLAEKESTAKPIKLPAGTTAKVFWVGTFRQIYRNGYNQLGRETLSTRLLIETDQGPLLINAPLNKLRLAAEPENDTVLQRKAYDLSFNFKIESLVGCRAWLSKFQIPQQLIDQLKAKHRDDRTIKTRDYTIEINPDHVVIKKTAEFYKHSTVYVDLQDWQRELNATEPHSGYTREEITASHFWATA